MNAKMVGAFVFIFGVSIAGASTARAHMWQAGTEGLDTSRSVPLAAMEPAPEPLAPHAMAGLGRQCLTACAGHFHAGSVGLSSCQSACEAWSARVSAGRAQMISRR